MRGRELCNVLQKELGASNDAALARALGVTPALVSIVRNKKGNLSTRRVAGFIKRTIEHKLGSQFANAIHPIVEFFEADRIESKQRAKWLPFDPQKHPDLRGDLKAHRGLYSFYNSEGEIIYFGKTRKRNLYDEMVGAFNRDMNAYSMLKVSHAWRRYKPSTTGFRQIRKTQMHIYDTARYFSCYRVEDDLIEGLEALMIRVIPNDLINVKMEKFSKPKKAE